MKLKNISRKVAIGTVTAVSLLMAGCQKFDEGFLSPYMQYAVNEFSIIRGRYATSYSMNLDGSSTPVSIRWAHVYDANGNLVDSIFRKKYPVTVWTAAYDPKTDTNYTAIIKKRTVIETEAITVSESNGRLEANAGSINLPLGTYTMDIEVNNVVGTKLYPKMMRLVIKDGKTLETTPETGAYSVGSLLANTPTGGPLWFNGNNNPFVVETIVRYADTPNVLSIKVLDKNGNALNPKVGQIMKRPNSGLNPNPPFLQNLQDYAPDTFVASDTAMSLKFPVVPFPVVSLGNGFNMYYRFPTQHVTIDSTSSWTSNTAGNFYKGTSDSHYKGVCVDGRLDYSLRIPLRIQVPGAYAITLKVLNVTKK